MHEDELYVHGRLKDLIIVRGQNIYPQDVERVVEAEVAAVRKGRIAAFRVDGPHGEGIGLAVEVGRLQRKRHAAAEIVRALHRAVGMATGEEMCIRDRPRPAWICWTRVTGRASRCRPARRRSSRCGRSASNGGSISKMCIRDSDEAGRHRRPHRDPVVRRQHRQVISRETPGPRRGPGVFQSGDPSRRRPGP